MTTLAAAARAIVADHLPDDALPPAVTRAARTYLDNADLASMRDFVTLLGAQAALHGMAQRPLGAVAADLFALRPDDLCAAANGDAGVRFSVEPVLQGADALTQHPDAPQALIDAAVGYERSGAAHTQAFAATLCDAAGASRCVRCGQYLSARRGHRCPPAAGAPQPRRRRRAGQASESAAEAAQGLSTEQDPINNETIASMFSRIATSIAGQPRRVIFGRPGSGFATDMRGKIFADPQPLGQGAPISEQLLVINAGIYHELGHEEFTPMGYWADLLEIAQSGGPVSRQVDMRFAGLGVLDITLDRARGDVPGCYNIVEDGRMERTISDEYRGVAEVLAASCVVDARWDEQVGDQVPTRYQLEGALLYTALPYFAVSPAARAGMSEEARALLDELEPIVARAVRGTAEDAYHASLYLAWRFEQAGLLEAPPPDVVGKRPPSSPPPGTQARRPTIVIDGDQVLDGGDGAEQPGGQSSVDVEYTGDVTIRNPRRRQGDEEDGGARSPSASRQRSRMTQPDGDRRPPADDAPEGGAGGRQRRADDDEQPAGRRGGGGDDAEADAPRQRQPDDEQASGGGRRARKTDEEEPVDRQRGGAGDDDQADERPQPQDDEGSGGGQRRGQQGDQDDQNQASQSSQSTGDTGGEKSGDADDVGGAVDWSDAVATSGPLRDADQPFDAEQPSGGARCTGRPGGGGARQPGARQRPAGGAGRGAAPADRQPHPRHAAVSHAQGRRGHGRGELPKANHRVSALTPRRSTHQAIARRLATQLAAIREETEQRLRKQPSGRLDRGRLVAAVKGQQDVRTRQQKYPNTSFAASIAVDMSGSMNSRISSYALYDAVMVLGDTFDVLDIPYEVRAFTNGPSAQMKAIDDPAFEPARAAALASWGGGATYMHEASSLASTALGGCPEANKIAISLTDGMLDDHEKTRAVLEESRRRGIVTFGVYVGAYGLNAQKMDELYGPGNWAQIGDLKEMPQQVGKRLATIFKRLRPV